MSDFLTSHAISAKSRDNIPLTEKILGRGQPWHATTEHHAAMKALALVAPIMEAE